MSFLRSGWALLRRNKQTAVSFGEALLYHHAWPASKKAGDVLSLIHHLALENFHFLQMVFTGAQAIFSVHSAKQIVHLVKHPIMQRSCSTLFGAYLPATVFVLTLVLVSGWIFSQKMQSEESYKSKAQVVTAGLQLAGVVQSLALAILTGCKVACLLRVAMYVYSFYQNNRLDWLSFQGERNVVGNPLFQGVKVSYHSLLFAKTPLSDGCSICAEESPPLRHVFCPNNHGFHKECLKDMLRYHNGFYEARRYRRIDTRHYNYGVYTGTTYSYKVTIKEDKFPQCPMCRAFPVQSTLKMSIHDRANGPIRAQVLIERANPKSYQKAFEKVHAFYNSFQGILGLLQQIPEFTGGITVLRRFMAISDVAMGIIANYYLFQRLHEERKNEFLGFLPAMLCAPFFLYLLGRCFGCKETLSPLTLNNVTARWGCPLSEHVHRLVNAYRFFTTLGLCFLSKVHKGYAIASLLGQGVGLIGTMRVRWLCVEQTGLGSMKVKLNTYAIISSKLSSTVEGVKSAIAYLTAFQRRIVNEGTAELVARHNGRVLFEALRISYTMKKVQDFREYLSTPFIWTMDGLVGRGTYECKRLHLAASLYRS